MDNFILKMTNDKPAVVFIPEKEIFQITGECWPENALKFCQPIFNWLEEYYNNKPLPLTTFDIRLTYFNTSAQKQIIKFLRYLKDKNKVYPTKINWYYKVLDEDAKQDAERYLQLLNLAELMEIKPFDGSINEIVKDDYFQDKNKQ